MTSWDPLSYSIVIRVEETSCELGSPTFSSWWDDCKEKLPVGWMHWFLKGDSRMAWHWVVWVRVDLVSKLSEALFVYLLFVSSTHLLRKCSNLKYLVHKLDVKIGSYWSCPQERGSGRMSEEEVLPFFFKENCLGRRRKGKMISC